MQLFTITSSIMYNSTTMGLYNRSVKQKYFKAMDVHLYYVHDQVD